MRYDHCKDGGRIREDAVMAVIQKRFAGIFKYKDQIIARALQVAADAVRENRDDPDRIKSQLAEVEQEQARGVELLMDRSISEVAKKAISRKLHETEQRRELFLAAMDGLMEQTNADT